MANYDILGNIAIVKFQDETPEEIKKRFAMKFLEEHGNVKTILEKTEKVHGRLRTIKTNFIAGEETLEAEYKESGCRFKLNVETCYFSPRLANERLEIAKKIQKLKAKKVLVMFSGVAPFPIVIAKYAKPNKIISIELGVECEKYARDNLWLNKVSDKIEHIQGDVNKILPKMAKQKDKYEVIVMPRPNLKDNFLKSALSVAKKGTLIFYYGFCAETKKEEMILDLEKTAKKLKRKIKIMKVLEAGDIAPYEHRYRVEIKVLK